MFTLDQIRSFVAVAEELHFGHAAERLNMTQPPLSRQIQKLEKTVGVQLIERDNRKVALTTAGKAFLADARKLLVSAEQAPLTARRIARGQAGVLRIGFTAASGFSVLGTLLSTLSEQLPDVDVDLREQVTREQVDSLVNGEIDLGLARPPIDHELFESRLLLSEALELVVPEGHPLAALDRPVAGADLREVPLIMYSPTKARYFYDLAIRNVPIQHGNVVHTVSQILTMVSLVAAGRGVALVPASAQRLGVAGVTHLPLADQTTDVVELHAIWRRGQRNPALHRLLAALDGHVSST
ncbi:MULTISPECIES: LysR family transcriptional regulator [unclassified Nesterenkonia]|uniref:LysR family transcriptional regulator n=1 Tax=unclassified Nesterenkonia TaxID=2629769 RepID=UPI0008723BED|nr:MULTISPECIES: LysR family transcriptional regulator [unclassified Nesterenkonia]MDS2172747.1 LysR family transcriptional regulator [Nesterenkonia sp. CL21]OSM43815.1 LysR family transcriptional regulator [Nesterenkonia sp. PF2B19]